MFYAVTRSWGFSIILLTIALRLMMYPLNNWSIRSSAKMQEIAPKIKAVQERYKKIRKKGQLEVMNLYRQEGINPFSGCFPILLQMPFLIGMFYLLKSTFPLRGAAFIPGWDQSPRRPRRRLQLEHAYFPHRRNSTRCRSCLASQCSCSKR